ncbi:MAG: translation initiation factor IF-2 [bacterium]|nr:translation initiation factor IF-2 [bacterium]
MNLTELARRLRTNPEELRTKLPELGFSIGRKAIKIDNRVAGHIQEAWQEMKRKERLAEKIAAQKASTDKTDVVKDKTVKLTKVMTVREFATRLELPIQTVMQELMHAGILASLNENIDFDTASILAGDLGYESTLEDGEDNDETKGVGRLEEEIATSRLSGSDRAPVVVVMGHVDHGKTKLLDAIRKTNVIDTEAGGITQHIGAYQVVHNDKSLTFIDTPGHEAFTVMRSRGAKVADIAILVIAADDGMQPQTREAIEIIKAAKMPVVVAINKIDAPGADVNKVLGELAEKKMVPEDWGGDTITVAISAKEGTNIEKLLEMILLVSEMEKEALTADASRSGVGTVIDSRIDKGQGPVATVLVQSGTLRVGDSLGVDGILYGKVRAMKDWNGQDVKEAPPSTPVMVLGWKSTPSVGDVMEVAKEKDLKKEKFQNVRSGFTQDMTAAKAILTEDDADKKFLPIIVKADVLGSLEALLGLVDRIKHESVGVTVVGRGLGNVTEADIHTAEATGAVIYAFGVKAKSAIVGLARDVHVEIKDEGIIYKIMEDLLERLQKLLPDAYIVNEIGEMEVLANFRKLENGFIFGGKVTRGEVMPNIKMRMFRGEEAIGEGTVLKVQAGVTAVKAARKGEECGVAYKGKTKLEPGDRVEFYLEEFQGRKLEIPGMEQR